MAYSLTFHNGSQVHQKNNSREYSVVSKEKHIDLNRYHENIYNFKLYYVYKRLFGKALQQYNAKIKDTHPERVMNLHEYINHLHIQSQKSTNSKKLTYEYIIQVGGADEHPDENTLIDIYKSYLHNWEKVNQNLVLLGTYIHCDEEGGPHMHIDYIPFAKCSRGMEYQPNLSKALEEQVFLSDKKTLTAQMKCEQAERYRLTQIFLLSLIFLHIHPRLIPIINIKAILNNIFYSPINSYTFMHIMNTYTSIFIPTCI